MSHHREEPDKDTKSKSHHSKKSHSNSHSKSHSKHHDSNPDLPPQPSNPPIDPPNLTNWNKQVIRTCITHSQPLKYYCDNCEEPICYECTTQGPHNTQIHRAITVEEAFSARYSNIQNAVSNSISKKREKIFAQMQRITQRTDEIKKVKTIIERDIRCEYSGVLERLRSSEGIKLAMLNHDTCELQNDLDRAEAIIMHMAAVTREKDMVKFLSIYVKLNEDIETILSKPLKTEIAVTPMDLPRELTERRKAMEDAMNYEKQCKYKDDIIWKMLYDKKQEDNSGIKKIEEETKKEFEEWAKLTDKFASELAKFDISCYFCGEHLGPATVNNECAQNSEVKENLPKEITQEMNGTKRHFFRKIE